MYGLKVLCIYGNRANCAKPSQISQSDIELREKLQLSGADYYVGSGDLELEKMN